MDSGRGSNFWMETKAPSLLSGNLPAQCHLRDAKPGEEIACVYGSFFHVYCHQVTINRRKESPVKQTHQIGEAVDNVKKFKCSCSGEAEWETVTRIPRLEHLKNTCLVKTFSLLSSVLWKSGRIQEMIQTGIGIRISAESYRGTVLEAWLLLGFSRILSRILTHSFHDPGSVLSLTWLLVLVIELIFFKSAFESHGEIWLTEPWSLKRKFNQLKTRHKRSRITFTF